MKVSLEKETVIVTMLVFLQMILPTFCFCSAHLSFCSHVRDFLLVRFNFPLKMHNNISISSLLYNILHYEKQFVFVSSEKHCMTLLIYSEGQSWIPKSEKGKTKYG